MHSCHSEPQQHTQPCDPGPSPLTLPRQVPTKTSGKSYQICGVINQVDDTTLEITELPIRKWTQVCVCLSRVAS